MSTSLFKKLSAVAVLLIALWVIRLYREVPQPKQPFANLDKSAEMKIERASQAVLFSKKDGTWKVKLENGDFVPVDEILYATLLASLKNVALETAVSDRADRAAEFEVHLASGTTVSLLDEKGKTLAAGIFGKQASDLVHIFYRPANSNEVFLARGLYRGELGTPDPLAWRSRQLVDIPEPDVKAMTIERKGGTSRYVRVSTSSWTLNGQAVAIEPVHGLVGKLSHLRADSYVTPLDQPQPTYEGLTYARVVIQGEKSQAEIRVGPLDKKAPRYPLSSGPQNGIAWLSQATVDSLLK